MKRVLQVVLPSFNEEVALPRLFPQFEQLSKTIGEEVRVLVVNDGSTDDTQKSVENWQGEIQVSGIHFTHNRGYGIALQEGITSSALALQPTDLIATMDADDTHPPAYLASMIQALDSQQLDVVIASRYAAGGKEQGVSLNRRILSRGASFFYRYAFHLPHVSDYSCGYRLFRASLIQSILQKRGNLGLHGGFHATGEILLRVREQTNRIGEVPFELHYERKPTRSKMPRFKTVIATIGFLFQVHRVVRQLPPPESD